MSFDVDMENVGAARRFVRSSLGSRIPGEVVTDLLLATSELVTNAFEHSASRVLVTVRSEGDRVEVSVRSDTGTAHAVDATSAWTIAPPERISGRGLGIVRHIADHIGIVRDGDGLEITVHRSL